MDEPSIGLAPEAVPGPDGSDPCAAARAGMSILLVEQNVRDALQGSDRVVVMKAGRIVREACRPSWRTTRR